MDDRTRQKLERLETDLGGTFFIRLYPLPIHGKFDPADRDWAFRIDLSGAASTLVLDVGDKYGVVYNRHLREWDIRAEDAFDLAMERITSLPCTVTRLAWDDFPMYGLHLPEAAAPRMLRPETVEAGRFLGREGLLFSVPSDSQAFLVPLDTADHEEISRRYLELIDATHSIYAECEKPVMCDVYWWRDGEIASFGTTWIEGARPFFMLPSPFQDVWWPQVENLPGSVPWYEPDEVPFACVSAQTNTHTGRVITLVRDGRGRVIGCTGDEFIEGWEVARHIVKMFFDK